MLLNVIVCVFSWPICMFFCKYTYLSKPMQLWFLSSDIVKLKSYCFHSSSKMVFKFADVVVNEWMKKRQSIDSPLLFHVVQSNLRVISNEGFNIVFRRSDTDINVAVFSLFTKKFVVVYIEIIDYTVLLFEHKDLKTNFV